MKKRPIGLLAAAALLSSGGALAQRPARSPVPAPVPAKTERTVPFSVGETLTYDVSWSSYLTAGTAVLSVKEKKPSYGSTAYYVVAEGRPSALLSKIYTLYYKMDTLIDTYSLLPQRASIYSEEGSDHRFRETRFDRGQRRAFFESRSETTFKSESLIPPDVQDSLSALYVLRAVPLRPGDRLTMPISDSGRNYKMVVQVTGLERLRSKLGELGTWRLKPVLYDADNQTVGRDINIWLSDDARRLPVKIQGELTLGSFVLSLKDAR